MSIRVIIAGGGTGGHVYPGLAVVERIRKLHPDSAFLWIGNPNKVEARVVPLANIHFEPMKLTGLSRRLSPQAVGKNIAALFQAAGAMRRAKSIISDFKPDVVIGTGGYASGPPVAQAARMKIPTALIEPNSFPGLTVRWLAKKVDCIFLGDKQAVQFLRGGNCIVSGIPVSDEVLNATREAGIHSHGLLAGKPCLLIVGGSQGAKNINKAVLEFVEIAHAEEQELLSRIQIHHQTGDKGPAELDGLRLEYPEADYIKTNYIDRMALALAAADLVVSRAGAATLSEIKARGLPSILVPYPYSAEGHQLKNARAMAETGAAIVIEDRELTGRSLFDVVIPLMKNTERREDMGDKAKQMFRPDCADVICTEIINLIGKENA